MSPEEYRQIWGELETFIDGMLTRIPGSSFSFQKLYSAVYKCCFLLEHERLYDDLRELVKTRLRQWSSALSDAGDAVFVGEFHKSLDHFFHALDAIVPVFIFMDKTYIKAKLHTDLETELRNLFTSLVADTHMTRVIRLMEEAIVAATVPSSTLATLCRHLYTLDPAHFSIHPGLFSSFR